MPAAATRLRGLFAPGLRWPAWTEPLCALHLAHTTLAPALLAGPLARLEARLQDGPRVARRGPALPGPSGMSLGRKPMGAVQCPCFRAARAGRDGPTPERTVLRWSGRRPSARAPRQGCEGGNRGRRSSSCGSAHWRAAAQRGCARRRCPASWVPRRRSRRESAARRSVDRPGRGHGSRGKGKAAAGPGSTDFRRAAQALQRWWDCVVSLKLSSGGIRGR